MVNIVLRRVFLTLTAMGSIGISIGFIILVLFLMFDPAQREIDIDELDPKIAVILADLNISVDAFDSWKYRIWKHISLVETLNNKAELSWVAKLNPSAIGLSSITDPVFRANERYSLMALAGNFTGLLERFENIIENAFYPLYDDHLKSLERQAHHVHVPVAFRSTSRWPHCSTTISLVPDQGGCWASWALAMASIIADRTCIAKKRPSGSQVSTQQLISCCDYCGGCTGTANPFFPLMYWHEDGLSDEKCLPYTIKLDCGQPCGRIVRDFTAGSQNCSSLDKCGGDRHFANYVYKVGSFDEGRQAFPITLFDYYKRNHKRYSGVARSSPLIREVEEMLKREILEHGPIMLCFNVFEGFLHYHDGIYDFTLQQNEVIYQNDHCVKVIGWGQRFNKHTDSYQRYLEAINVWSNKWGNNGTFKIDVDRLRDYQSNFFAGIPRL